MATEKRNADKKNNSGSQPTPPWKVLTAGGVAGAVRRKPHVYIAIGAPEDHVSDSAYGWSREKIQRHLWLVNHHDPRGGAMGFFKGNGTNCIRIAPYSAVQFYTFENSKSWLKDKVPDPAYGSLIAGGLAGVTALIVTYPLDLIRTRLTIQTTQQKYHGIWDTFQTVVKEEGTLALYKGVGTSSMGIFPYSAINFAVYDTLKRIFVNEKSQVGVVESLTYGGIAGAVAQTITYPVDLLRRRMQLQGAGGAPRLYDGPVDAVRKIVKQEGFRGLYQGMIPCYLKVVPSIAISFCTYEVMRRILGIEQKTNFGAG